MFAELFMAEASKLETVQRIEQDPEDPFRLRVWRHDVSEPWLAHLDGIFQETREYSPERRLAQIQRFLTVFSKSADEPGWNDVSGRLLPVVRAAGFASHSTLELIARPFLPFLELFVVIDDPDSIAFVSRTRLDEWQKTPNELFESAFETLANWVSESDVEMYDSDASSPIFQVASHDDYEPSRLAAPGFLASFAGKVPGNPIAIIPDRSRMLIAGDGDPRVLARLARSAEAEYNASARAISPAVYTIAANGGVQPLHLPRDHAEYFAIERGHRVLAANSYDSQKKLLEARFERDEIDIFVASLSLLQDKDTGEVRSWAVMPEGVDSLLPEADLIALGGLEREGIASPGNSEQKRWTAMVPWRMVFELAPECLVRSSEYDPPRWRTVAWPSEEAIVKLRAHARAAQNAP